MLTVCCVHGFRAYVKLCLICCRLRTVYLRMFARKHYILNYVLGGAQIVIVQFCTQLRTYALCVCVAAQNGVVYVYTHLLNYASCGVQQHRIFVYACLNLWTKCQSWPGAERIFVNVGLPFCPNSAISGVAPQWFLVMCLTNFSKNTRFFCIFCPWMAGARGTGGRFRISVNIGAQSMIVDAPTQKPKWHKDCVLRFAIARKIVLAHSSQTLHFYEQTPRSLNKLLCICKDK